MKQRFSIKPLRVILFVVATATMALASGETKAGGGSNTLHELMVYSLEEYGYRYDYCTSENKRWKGSIYLSYYQNPYRYFWDEMYTNCSTSVCANTYSYRRRNSAVTVDTMINDRVNDWEDADMVFFYGHNAMIQPQWSNDDFHWWKPQYSGDLIVGWCEEEDEWLDWGTSEDPYYYHNNVVYQASAMNPGAVFYAYNSLTSVLAGFDYRLGDSGIPPMFISDGLHSTTAGSAASWSGLSPTVARP